MIGHQDSVCLSVKTFSPGISVNGTFFYTSDNGQTQLSSPPTTKYVIKWCFVKCLIILMLISETNQTPCRGVQGPYSVTIILTNDSSEVLIASHLVIKDYLPCKEDNQTKLNTPHSTAHNHFDETNRNHCSYQNVASGRNGLSLKRFLPRDTTGESTHTYLLTRSRSRATEREDNPDLNTHQKYGCFPLF